jgi:hypothetical protein
MAGFFFTRECSRQGNRRWRLRIAICYPDDPANQLDGFSAFFYYRRVRIV